MDFSSPNGWSTEEQPGYVIPSSEPTNNQQCAIMPNTRFGTAHIPLPTRSRTSKPDKSSPLYLPRWIAFRESALKANHATKCAPKKSAPDARIDAAGLASPRNPINPTPTAVNPPTRNIGLSKGKMSASEPEPQTQPESQPQLEPQPELASGVPVDHELAPLVEFLESAEQEEASAKQPQQEDDERREAERQDGQEFPWPGDPSAYPAECCENLRLPGCEYRARAICVGTPQEEWLRSRGRGRGQRMVYVYAVRGPEGGGGGGGVEYKATAEPSPSPAELARAERIPFVDIQLNANFEDMDEKMVARWSRYLLAAVPGTDDAITTWSKA
ncbi:hypothetical protein F4802DRAFT_615419 [Xylaria palmicola]|nr:hypothetical protein F4802DRAFT_615419 [Xylaria palmicola]